MTSADARAAGSRGAGRRRLGRASGLVALFALSAVLLNARDAQVPDAQAPDFLYVRSPSVMRRVVLEYDDLAADVFWIRAVQHFGTTRLLQHDSQKDYALLEPLLTLTTGLDPYFDIAYRFGAIFLSEPPPGGPGQPLAAVRLLEQGLAARPDRWRYMQDIGFIHYWWRHDYPAAAHWFNRAADTPGAPWWLRSMAASVLAQGGDRQASRQLWQALAASAENDWLRRNATLRLQQLDTLDAIDTLQRVVREYAASGGKPPYSWDGLVRAGRLRGIPMDSAGFPLRINATSGIVTLSPESSLHPLPTEGTRAGGGA